MIPAEASARPEARAAHLWREAGLAEHASIASFSCFLLQMLSLGAPPGLLQRGARAISDEITHALLCFRVAQRIDGERIGPGPLNVEGSGEVDRQAILEAAISEGCVAETVSAHLAASALPAARHPSAIKALRRIHVDEGTHAELAWDFVEWMLRRYPEMCPHARRWFAQALDPPHNEFEPVQGAGIEVFGQMTAAERDRRARSVAETVVRPRMEALFARLEQPVEAAN